MAAWRRVLVVGLAVLVGAFPVLARVDAGLQVAATAVPQAEVPLPQGDEVEDDELLQAEGELFWLAAVFAFCFGAALGAWHEYYEDEDHGVDWDDAPAIVAGGAAMVGGYLIGHYAP